MSSDISEIVQPISSRIDKKTLIDQSELEFFRESTRALQDVLASLTFITDRPTRFHLDKVDVSKLKGLEITLQADLESMRKRIKSEEAEIQEMRQLKADLIEAEKLHSKARGKVSLYESQPQ